LFLVGGTDFANDHLIEYSSGLLNSWTQRAWGRILAEWAKATGWMPKLRGARPWDEVVFSYYLYEWIDRYEPWAETVLQVTQMKCARRLAAEQQRRAY
jgi:hypothetical protein